MSGAPPSSSRRLLDPVERTSEVLFGLIMALSFTCSISAAEAGRADVRAMMAGAIGCNIAWGLIDAVIYLMTSLTERARGISLLRSVRRTTSPEAAGNLIAGALPPVVAATLTPDDLAKIHRELSQTAEPPGRPCLHRGDFVAAGGVFLLVFLATFPVVIPFLFIQDPGFALRVSNVVALGMLFMAGYALGRHARFRPVGMGLAMMLIGVVLVAITIALGG